MKSVGAARAVRAATLVWAASATACGHHATKPATPALHGPYRRSPSEGPLPAQPALQLGPRDEAYFLWSNPAGGKTLHIDLVAAAAPPLTVGGVIDSEDHALKPGTLHGSFVLRPHDFSTGGARRNREGRYEWVPGLYQVRVRLDGKPIGEIMFETAKP